MKKRQLKKMFKKQIQFVVDSVNENIKVVHNKNRDRMLYYQISKKTIGFNVESYMKDYNQNVKLLGITLKKSIIIGTLHEIGHHKDENVQRSIEEIRELNATFRTLLKGEMDENKIERILIIDARKKQIIAEYEKVAWELACSLNQKYGFVSRAHLLTIQEMTLSTYLSSLEEANNHVIRFKEKKKENAKTAIV